MPGLTVFQKLRRFSGNGAKRTANATQPTVVVDEQAQKAAAACAVFARFPQPYKLHIACGSVKLPGWVHVDRDAVSETVEISWDVRQPLPIADCSCQFIFHEHFLEHLTVQEGLAFLRESHRLLATGGVLRVSMPDLSECVRQYYENDWSNKPWLKKYGFEWIQTRAEFLNIAMREWEHKWLYDREELHRRLREAGFVRVRDCVRLQSTVPELCGLETRDETLLVCEAIK